MYYIPREGEILWIETNIESLKIARQKIDEAIFRLERRLQDIKEDETRRHGSQRP